MSCKVQSGNVRAGVIGTLAASSIALYSMNLDRCKQSHYNERAVQSKLRGVYSCTDC